MPVTEGDEGANIAILEGLALPFQDQNGQPVIVPVGRIQVPMGKSAIARLINLLQDVHDKLADPKPQSNIFVPGSMDEVDQVANNLKNLGAT